MTTKAQEWARKRNGAKLRLMGCAAQIKILSRDIFLLPKERESLKVMSRILDILLKFWSEKNEESKRYYLKKYENK